MEERAKHISTPIRGVTLDGEQYALVFNNRAARVAEEVYEQQYARDAGYMEILQEMARLKHRALMALVYGAMIAGGAQMEWDDFEQRFSYDALDGLKDAIKTGVLDSLPTADEKN